jgi:hypothetical protein
MKLSGNTVLIMPGVAGVRRRLGAERHLVICNIAQRPPDQEA